MRKLTRVVAVVLLSLPFLACVSSLNATQIGDKDDFFLEYSKLDSLKNIEKLVYNGAISPTWLDDSTFAYEIRERDSLRVYRVDVMARVKSLWDIDSLTAFIEDAKVKVKPSNSDTIISPNGLWESYVRDSNIWLREVVSEKEYQLSFDGTANDFYTKIYWSDDSKKIAAIKKQDSPMRRIPLITSAPERQQQPTLEWKNYYKPGDLIPVYRPALFDVDAKSKIEIDTKPFEDQFYLSFRKWSPDSKHFVFDYNQRGHRVYQIVNVCSDTGKTTIVVDEEFPTFVHYRRNYIHYLEDGESLIWSSERDGWRHLYMIDASSGSVMRQLTRGDWVVRGVVDVDENSILFYGNGKNRGEDPYNLHYYRIGLDGRGLVDLTPENASHKVSFSPSSEYFVDSYSRPDMPAVSVLRSSRDGSVIMELAKSDVSDLLATGWTMPEVFSAKGRDGKTDILGTIYRPSNFDASVEYPVVEYIYAGPHDAHVTKNFAGYMRFSKLLELGFIVVTVDGMGTANRSKKFHDVCWRNLKDAGFPDRILWIKAAAAKYNAMDIVDGVGIYGYSAGGQNAMAALLFHPDFYTVGVALCGCHDNRMDKIWWNEQWMGYPLGPWYSESSNTDNAHLLEGRLLLINGELDSNVDPTSTLQVVNALVKADKYFEQLYLPNYGHSLGDNFVTRRVFEFFDRSMK